MEHAIKNMFSDRPQTNDHLYKAVMKQYGVEVGAKKPEAKTPKGGRRGGGGPGSPSGARTKTTATPKVAQSAAPNPTQAPLKQAEQPQQPPKQSQPPPQPPKQSPPKQQPTKPQEQAPPKTSGSFKKPDPKKK